MNRTFLLIALAFNLHLSNVNAQLTLEACQEKARLNYPLIKQYGLIEEAEEYNLSNASRGYLPQISLSAKVTYQSEVTEIPVSMPGVEGLNKGQYQAVAEVNQILWDGGVIQAQKKLTKTSTEVDKQKTEVDLFALRDR
ncbi:MAG: TolC family protein, partial [Bacteroidales bacterium]|nr:TolC family protein [Bacteroidales bacterium]